MRRSRRPRWPWCLGFFPGRQSLLACLLLECGEISGRIAAETGASRPGETPRLKLLAEVTPAFEADAAEVARGGRMQPRRGGSDQAHLAAQHQRRGGRLASGGAPLVVALGAEHLLEIVVGARQRRDRVAVEQARPVAAGDLQEVLDGADQAAGLFAVASHGADQAIEAPTNGIGGLACGVAEDVGGAMHPAIDPFDLRPEGGGPLQAAADQRTKPRQRRRRPPFSVTRSRLSATASSRALSFSPEAASGGRPSSVMALRTAAQ